MKQVLTAESPAQAHLVVGLLEESGIDAVVEGELLTGVLYGISNDDSTRPQVWVRDEDATRATDVLRRPEVPDPSPSEDERIESRALTWFKRALLAWMIVSAAALCVVLVVNPPTLAIVAAFAIVAILVWPAVRSKRDAGTPSSRS